MGYYMIGFALVVHLVFKGFLWQLTPIYLVVIGLIGLSIIDKMPSSIFFKSLLSIVTILMIGLSVFLFVAIPIFKFPSLSGNFTVGVKYDVVYDDSRSNREIKLKVFYPSDQFEGIKDVFHPNPTKELNGLMGMPGFVFGHLSKVNTGGIVDATLSDTNKKYPTVFYSHGASSSYIDNTYLMTELASQGYIVIAVDHNFEMTSYGIDKKIAMSMDIKDQLIFINDLLTKVVPDQGQDILFVKETITNRQDDIYDHIDATNVILMGHSLGGTTAAFAANVSGDIKAVINMDGPMTDEISELRSYLYLSSYDPNESDEFLKSKKVPVEFYRTIKNEELKSIDDYFSNQYSNHYWGRLIDAGHLDFTDLGFMTTIMKTNNYDYIKGKHEIHRVIVSYLNSQTLNTNFSTTNTEILKWID